MQAEEIAALYEATDGNGAGWKGVYVLGGFLALTERIAVASQQTRAINLVDSLLKSGRLEKGQRICVIGGGAAGLTAAAYAIENGIGVTVLENRAPLWNLRGCRTRWLHPNLFRWWPDPRWQCTGTDLPVMNWFAGYACEVGDLLWSKYRAFEQRQLSWSYPAHPRLQIVGDIRLEARGHRWYVGWDLAARGVWQQDEFDAVILAIGFGSETRARDAEASVYWLDDALEREDPHRLRVRYLVSGTGDGGLTDLLRIRVAGFRHHHLRESLLALELHNPELSEGVERIEIASRAGKDPTVGYLDLARQFRFRLLLDSLRERTKVVLTNRGTTALGGGAWPISRFLAATLLVGDAANTQYRPGPAQRKPIVPTEGEAPSHFEVTFPDSPDVERFDAIVIRHGTARPAAAFLKAQGMNDVLIKGAQAKWTALAHTDQCVVSPITNFEQPHRNRNATVPPAIAGRTIIGMLSRLVAAVGPQHELEKPAAVLQIQQPIVNDETAALLTQHADRMERYIPLTDGWRLGQELEHDSVVEVIRAADKSLKGLWDSFDSRRDELLRAWVLPLAPWLPPGPLLDHTRVARHWRSMRLAYRRHGAFDTARKPTGKSSAAIRSQLLRIPEAVDAASTVGILAIVDMCAARVRAAVSAQNDAHSRRLAKELGAEKFFHSSMMEEMINDS